MQIKPFRQIKWQTSSLTLMYYLKSHIISSRRTKLGDFVNSESQNSNQMQQGNVILMKGELGDFW